MSNADDCWRPVSTVLCIDSHLPAVCVPVCCLFVSAHLSTLDSFTRQHHSLFPFLPSLVWASLIASTARWKWGRLHGNMPSRGRRVVGALSQLLASIGHQRVRETTILPGWWILIIEAGLLILHVCYLFNIWYERDSILEKHALCMSVVVHWGEETHQTYSHKLSHQRPVALCRTEHTVSTAEKDIKYKHNI